MSNLESDVSADFPFAPQLPARGTQRSGNYQVWIKIANQWRLAFSSNDYSDARHWSREHIRYGGAVEKIELRDLSGKVEPIYDMTWPR